MRKELLLAFQRIEARHALQGAKEVQQILSLLGWERSIPGDYLRGLRVTSLYLRNWLVGFAVVHLEEISGNDGRTVSIGIVVAEDGGVQISKPPIVEEKQTLAKSPQGSCAKFVRSGISLYHTVSIVSTERVQREVRKGMISNSVERSHRGRSAGESAGMT